MHCLRHYFWIIDISLYGHLPSTGLSMWVFLVAWQLIMIACEVLIWVPLWWREPCVVGSHTHTRTRTHAHTHTHTHTRTHWGERWELHIAHCWAAVLESIQRAFITWDTWRCASVYVCAYVCFWEPWLHSIPFILIFQQCVAHCKAPFGLSANQVAEWILVVVVVYIILWLCLQMCFWGKVHPYGAQVFSFALSFNIIIEIWTQLGNTTES